MRPRLRVVDDQGQVHDGCPGCDEAERTLVQYERDMRILKAKITKLERDIEIDARKDPLWDEGEGIFQWFALACNHEGCRFEAEELHIVKPHLKRVGPVGCLQAICGAAFEPYETRQRNGRIKKHDGWDTIFATKAKMERFAERVPGEEGSQLWKTWLIQRIESNLS